MTHPRDFTPDDFSWLENKRQIIALLRQHGHRKVKIPIPFVRWTIKFDKLADQIEQYT